MQNKKNSFSKKIKSILVLSLAVVAVLSFFAACTKDPIVAFITDGTSAGSDDYTINIDFMEDKRFDEKYIDVLFKSDTDNLTIIFKREFDEDTTLTLPQKDKWYSMTNLLDQENGDENENYQNFDDRNDLTLVIKSEQDAFLTIKAVCGDLKKNSEGQEILVNMVDISKEFVLDLGEHKE